MSAPTRTPATPTPAFAPDSPWGRCMTHFLQQIYGRSHSEKSRYQYRNILADFFSTSADDGPPKLPDNYTREDILWFIHRATHSPRSRGKPPSASTVNARQSTIASFYRFASAYTYSDQEGRIAVLFDHASPTAGLPFRKVARRYRALSFEELERLFAVIPTETVKGLRDRAMLLMYLWTARRRSEIADLRWGDIEAGVIVDTDGTKREGHVYTFHNKGSKTVDDIFELPDPAYQAIVRYLKASGRLATMHIESPLFVSDYHISRREQPLRGDSIEAVLKSYVRKAGLDAERITIHSLRHTSVQTRYRLGEDIRSLQHLLRHTNLATTDIYLNALVGTADPGAKLLEKSFGTL